MSIFYTKELALVEEISQHLFVSWF